MESAGSPARDVPVDQLCRMRGWFAGRVWQAGGMAISLNTAASGSGEEAAAVIDAVLAASPTDELDWIEWKSILDLTSKPVQGTLARHILGMANRQPERASAHAGGQGFLVVGAEPGNRCGIRAADPASLSQAIDTFLGQERPSWTMHYDERDGSNVLVITVAAPQPGDPIFTLHKELRIVSPSGKQKEYPRGTIFVRHLGRTEIAKPEDISGLLERHAAPLREAEALARETLEIARARQGAEERQRRRRTLLDIQSLVNEIFFKASQVNIPGRWRCKEQLDLNSYLIDMDVDLKACRMLAGAGQGSEAITWAVQARHEMEAELSKLASKLADSALWQARIGLEGADLQNPANTPTQIAYCLRHQVYACCCAVAIAPCLCAAGVLGLQNRACKP